MSDKGVVNERINIKYKLFVSVHNNEKVKQFLFQISQKLAKAIHQMNFLPNIYIFKNATIEYTINHFLLFPYQIENLWNAIL